MVFADEAFVDRYLVGRSALATALSDITDIAVGGREDLALLVDIGRHCAKCLMDSFESCWCSFSPGDARRL